jgi:hypothetical protein
VHAFAIKIGLIFALLCSVPANAGEEDALRLERKRSESLERARRGLYTPFFKGVVFRKCSEIEHLSLETCEAKQYLIRYAFGKFAHVDDPTRFNPWPWDSFKIVPNELANLKVYNKLQLSAADYFYAHEALVVESCFRNECRGLFEKNQENTQEILWDGISPSVYWRGLNTLFSCLNKIEYSDPKTMREQKRLAFKNANIGIYVPCFSDETPKRIITDAIPYYREFENTNNRF